MVLEATVLCLDNSEWMRNGDYTPTRMEAQHDAANLICGAKTQQNPENTVAAVAAAGKSPEVLVTLTSDLGKLLSSMHGVKLGGNLNFIQAIQVAQLVLKHRQNKSQQQRIIFFVGSPIADDTNELVKLAKRLKKNNVAVDVINFGEEEANTEKLEAFRQAVNSNDNSHLVNIPPGPHVLSDIIISSPIITGEEGMGVTAGGPSSGATSDFGMYNVDPNLDPELALALKISMEEARAQEEANKKKETEGQAQPQAQTQSEKPSVSEAVMSDATEDDDEMAQALAMSMQSAPAPAQTPKPAEQKPTPSTSSTSTTSTATPIKEETMGEAEDDELALALQLSMQGTQSDKPQTSESQDLSKVMQDPNFVNDVLSTLPGVDPNDETIKNVLASISKGSDEKKDKK